MEKSEPSGSVGGYFSFIRFSALCRRLRAYHQIANTAAINSAIPNKTNSGIAYDIIIAVTSSDIFTPPQEFEWVNQKLTVLRFFLCDSYALFLMKQILSDLLESVECRYGKGYIHFR